VQRVHSTQLQIEPRGLTPYGIRRDSVSRHDAYPPAWGFPKSTHSEPAHRLRIGLQVRLRLEAPIV
jgi:hypothetical protein